MHIFCKENSDCLRDLRSLYKSIACCRQCLGSGSDRIPNESVGLLDLDLQILAILSMSKKVLILVFSSVADPDPGSGAFLTPGSGIRDPE